MSVDPRQSQGVEPACIALDEFRVTQDECTEFFGEMFDQLQALSLELFARHKCLEAGTEQKVESAKTLVRCREEFRRSTEELQRLHAQFQADQQETQRSWAEIRAGIRQMAGEFSGIKEELKRMWNLLETSSSR